MDEAVEVLLAADDSADDESTWSGGLVVGPDCGHHVLASRILLPCRTRLARSGGIQSTSIRLNELAGADEEVGDVVKR